jgi:hypothetical protein
MGEDDSGFLLMAYKKAGGYYLGLHIYPTYSTAEPWLIEIVSETDVGASQLIIDGKIKLKNDSHIERFTKTGIKFQNGSELQADVVLFATG